MRADALDDLFHRRAEADEHFTMSSALTFLFALAVEHDHKKKEL